MKTIEDKLIETIRNIIITGRIFPDYVVVKLNDIYIYRDGFRILSATHDDLVGSEYSCIISRVYFGKNANNYIKFEAELCESVYSSENDVLYYTSITKDSPRRL